MPTPKSKRIRNRSGKLALNFTNPSGHFKGSEEDIAVELGVAMFNLKDERWQIEDDLRAYVSEEDFDAVVVLYELSRTES